MTQLHAMRIDKVIIHVHISAVLLRNIPFSGIVCLAIFSISTKDHWGAACQAMNPREPISVVSPGSIMAHGSPLPAFTEELQHSAS